MIDPVEHLRNRGFTPAKLAGLMTDITSQAISQWKRVPVERVIEVERVTGISRHELRPDLSKIFVGASTEAEADDEVAA